MNDDIIINYSSAISVILEYLKVGSMHWGNDVTTCHKLQLLICLHFSMAATGINNWEGGVGEGCHFNVASKCFDVAMLYFVAPSPGPLGGSRG